MNLKEIETRLKTANMEVSDCKIIQTVIIKIKGVATVTVANDGKITVDGKSENVATVKAALGVE